jgi:hypothetical protein
MDKSSVFFTELLRTQQQAGGEMCALNEKLFILVGVCIFDFKAFGPDMSKEQAKKACLENQQNYAS